MTIQEANYYLLNRLRNIYPEGESAEITDWVMEHLTGSKKAERMIYKNSAITPTEELQLQQYTERLLHNEPVQYVFNEAWFYGLNLYVDKHVLIPRPETEELVDWVVKEAKSRESGVGSRESETKKIIDIGTGSGCIAIALKNKLPDAEVWACDINEEALAVARKNATRAGVLAEFVLLDFLDEKQRKPLPAVDIIISNPPYVPLNDKKKMNENVINYEPHTALFVPDDDALVFYKAIAEFGKSHLKNNGGIFAEIHESMGDAAVQVFQSKGYTTQLKKDMQGKERILKAEL